MILNVLHTGDKLPSFNLNECQRRRKKYFKNNRIKKNTVILFKDYKHASDEWIASRTNYLIRKNPKVNFMVVNLSTASKRYTKKIDIKHQYTLPKTKYCLQFFI